MQKMDWVEIISYGSRMEATVAKSFLDSEGIDAQVRSDDLAGTKPYLEGLGGGVKLFVRQKDAQEAKMLLESALPEP